jgi:murein DD-endopeptidase MepM/ murein hydrolase activator NlpD
MRRISHPLLIITLFILASCGRAENGLSPFEVLAEKFEQKESLPDQPVAGPSTMILPDAELVYGPSTADFSSRSVIRGRSILANYQELVDERPMTGAEILDKISRDYSVNPRLLLAVLEYQAGWLTEEGEGADEFPFLKDDPARNGLFRQLSWLANELNRGFYSRRVGGLKRFTTLDGVEVIVSPDANDATAAIQYALARMLGYHDWLIAAGPLGISAQYTSLFGAPFDKTDNTFALEQPDLRLPFAEEEGWFFTSGPHSAWGNGAAWAALDFAPDEEGYGCYDSDAWVLAAADGLIVRSEYGIVVQDLDSDGFLGTGWTILYMHIAERNRVEVGVYLNSGERIGHTSCEGGPATGTHLHLARRFNGEWIPADQDIPFVLSGWVSSGAGVEYDGTLSRNERMIEASGFPTDENKILN